MTPKQGTLLGYIGLELKRVGYEVLLTCREYEYTVGSLKRLGFNPLVIGKYVEGGSKHKVLADIERMKELLDVASEWGPDVLIAYPNPPAARIAFGLSIKYLALTDSPHSVIPSRLSLPLSDVVIYPSAIPQEEIAKFVTKYTKLVPYNGVDEIAWIIRSKPSLNYLVRELSLNPCSYVVIRPHEHLATYYRGIKVDVDLIRLIKGINDLGLTAVVLPRYSIHEKLVTELREEGLNVKMIKGGYDGVSLTYYALAVITGGASMAREAAILNTLGITYFPGDLYVNNYLMSKGYPLIKSKTTDEILKHVSNALKSNYCIRKDVDKVYERIRDEFEDPINTVIKELEDLLGDD